MVIYSYLWTVLAPYEENDLPFPDDYSEFQKPRPGAWLGTDVDDRDILPELCMGQDEQLVFH